MINPRIKQLQQTTKKTEQITKQQTGMAEADIASQGMEALRQAQNQGIKGPAAIQQIAGQATAATEQTKLQGQQQVAETKLKAQSELLQIKESQQKNAIQNRAISIEQRKNELEGRLQRLRLQYGQELFKKEIRFKRDELGRKYMNEVQLMDWQITKVKNFEEYKNYEQKVMQISERKMKLLQAAENRLRQEMKQKWELGEVETAGQAAIELQQAIQDMEVGQLRAQARAKARFARMQMQGELLFGGIGAVASTVFTGNPMLGYEAGGGISNIFMSATMQ